MLETLLSVSRLSVVSGQHSLENSLQTQQQLELRVMGEADELFYLLLLFWEGEIQAK